MRLGLWFCCAALLNCGTARAEWPRINASLKAKQVTIRKVVVLPAQIAYQKGGRFRGVNGGTEESGQIARSFYSAVSRELSLRGVEVLPNPQELAKTDTERYAIADLQTRYDAIAVQMRKNPGWLEHGRITLDDRVARFAPGAGADALVFLRGNQQLGSFTMTMAQFHAEVTFVDAKTGEVLALIRFGVSRDVAKKTEERLARGLRESMHDLPLPMPPPKK